MKVPQGSQAASPWFQMPETAVLARLLLQEVRVEPKGARKCRREDARCGRVSVH